MSLIRKIRRLAGQKGYTIFKEPYKLNIWGFRANSTTPNRFDDEIHVFTNISKGVRPKWLYMVCPATTDPGTFWLRNPMNPQGTAILNPGQYIDVWAIGMHRGKYPALVQRYGSVSVTRDYDRDALLDFYNGKVIRGNYGINIHRSAKVGEAYRVEKYSAGCQVFQRGKDWEAFMALCEKHREAHGNKFSYTLIDERMNHRGKIRRNLIGGLSGLLLLFALSKLTN